LPPFFYLLILTEGITSKLIINKFMLARLRLDLTCKCQYRAVSTDSAFAIFPLCPIASLRCCCVTIVVSNMK